jgi:hypothetical protein
MQELYDYPESSRTAQLVRGLARYSDLRPFNPRTFAAEHAPGRPPG